MRHVAGERQLADVLTKPLDRRRFVTLVDHMMNTANLVDHGEASGAGGEGDEAELSECKHGKQQRPTQ